MTKKKIREKEKQKSPSYEEACPGVEKLVDVWKDCVRQKCVKRSTKVCNCILLSVVAHLEQITIILNSFLKINWFTNYKHAWTGASAGIIQFYSVFYAESLGVQTEINCGLRSVYHASIRIRVHIFRTYIKARWVWRPTRGRGFWRTSNANWQSKRISSRLSKTLPQFTRIIKEAIQ